MKDAWFETNYAITNNNNNNNGNLWETSKLFQPLLEKVVEPGWHEGLKTNCFVCCDYLFFSINFWSFLVMVVWGYKKIALLSVLPDESSRILTPSFLSLSSDPSCWWHLFPGKQTALCFENDCRWSIVCSTFLNLLSIVSFFRKNCLPWTEIGPSLSFRSHHLFCLDPWLPLILTYRSCLFKSKWVKDMWYLTK